MGKVILQMIMSLDGYITGPDGTLDWEVSDDDMDRDFLDLINRVDTALIGHGVYSEMVAYWPTAAQKPSASNDDIAFANKINALPKLVFTDCEEDEELAWNNARLFVVKDDLARKITALKQQPGKDMVLYGGVHLAQSFARAGLIDEYQLVVHPVVLGGGKPLFEAIPARINLKLVRAKPYRSGTVMLCYQPA